MRPYRSGLAGTVRDLLATRQLTDRITISDREVLGEPAPSRLMVASRGVNVTSGAAPDPAAMSSWHHRIGEAFTLPPMSSW